MISEYEMIRTSLANFSLDPFERRYTNATVHSATHDQRRKKFEAELTSAIVGPMKSLLCNSLLTLEHSSQGRVVPALFQICGGDKCLDKLKLVSKVGQRTGRYDDTVF